MATLIVGVILALLAGNGVRVHLKMMRRGRQEWTEDVLLRLDLQRFGLPAEPRNRDQEK